MEPYKFDYDELDEFFSEIFRDQVADKEEPSVLLTDLMNLVRSSGFFFGCKFTSPD